MFSTTNGDAKIIISKTPLFAEFFVLLRIKQKMGRSEKTSQGRKENPIISEQIERSISATLIPKSLELTA
jgi:hypothetical protein